MKKPSCLPLLLFTFVLGATVASATADDKAEWTPLFNGKNFDGWKKYNGQPVGKGWVAEDGVLTLKEKGGGDIITEQKFQNFELEFEWNIENGSNSGVMYLVRSGDKAPYFSGPEFQILDDARHRDGKNPKTSVGALYALVAADGKEVQPPGEWNKGKIRLHNGQLQHFVNGKKVVEIEVRGEKWNELVAASKFSKWKMFGQASEGHICLQDHGDPVSFRNIRIRRLK